MSATAIFQNSDLLKENWKVHTSTATVTQEAKVSYLLVEQIEPPTYMWSKICAQLDAEENTKLKTKHSPIHNKIIYSLLFSGIAFSIFIILYFLLE